MGSVYTQGSLRKKFTDEGDQKLKELYKKYTNNGKTDWHKISEEMGLTDRQVMDRWKFHLKPDISNDPFSPEEDELLLEKQKEKGNKWTKFSQLYFINKTPDQLKNRFRFLQKNNQGTKAIAPVPSMIHQDISDSNRTNNSTSNSAPVMVNQKISFALPLPKLCLNSAISFQKQTEDIFPVLNSNPDSLDSDSNSTNISDLDCESIFEFWNFDFY